VEESRDGLTNNSNGNKDTKQNKPNIERI